MALKNGSWLCKVRCEIENISPFSIGNGEGEPLISIDDNTVYFPGSTIAGAFKDYLNISNIADIDVLFGEKKEISKYFFMDSYSKLQGHEKRPGVAINKKLGNSANKFERLYLSKGHKFEIRCEIYGGDEEGLKDRVKNILYCFKGISEGKITFGSYKSGGAGLFKINYIEEYSINLLNTENFFNFVLRDESYKKINLNEVMDIEEPRVIFELKGKIKTPILTKGSDTLDFNQADAKNFTDSEGNYIIPGTSFKGVVRSHGERILKYLGKVDEVSNIFGDGGANKKASIFYAFDTVIENPKTVDYNRIKINKFTGATIKGSLFSDEPISGELTLRCQLKLSKKEDEKYIGLISMILRDIARGELSLGSGNSVGRGRVIGQEIIIKRGNDILFKGDVVQNNIEINNINTFINNLCEVK